MADPGEWALGLALNKRPPTTFNRGVNIMAEHMTLKECLEIVRDLATENMIDFKMAEEDNGALMDERIRQREAIDRVYFAVEAAYSNPDRMTGLSNRVSGF